MSELLEGQNTRLAVLQLGKLHRLQGRLDR